MNQKGQKLRTERQVAIDFHVGVRLRERRVELGLSQEQLAGRIGMTFQQVQKYEKGINRIGASRLWETAAALQVPVGYFFEGLEGGNETLMRASRETLDLVRNLRELPRDLRHRVAEFVKVLARDLPAAPPSTFGQAAE
jgi:transcriptional regulator with XRE-family HTH domain